MAKIDVAKMWSLNYRLLTSVITGVLPRLTDLGIDAKELFLLAEVDESPYPAELAETLLMPKPTVTVLVKRMEAAGYLRRELDANDLRRFRLTLTPSGRRATDQARVLLDEAFGRRVARLTQSQLTELMRCLERMA